MHKLRWNIQNCFFKITQILFILLGYEQNILNSQPQMEYSEVSQYIPFRAWEFRVSHSYSNNTQILLNFEKPIQGIPHQFMHCI